MTDGSPPGGGTSSKAMNEAAAWVSRLIKEDPEPNYEALKAWHDASEENSRAFANAIFAQVIAGSRRERLERALGKSFPSLHPPAAQIIPIESARTAEADEPRGLDAPARKRLSRGARICLLTAACAAAIAMTVGVAPTLSGISIFSRADAEFYETGHGDIRSFALADGSNVTLDTDSRVKVVMDRELRRAHVEEGRARFIIKPDPRPFAIEAGAGKVIARSGSIDVAVDRNRHVDLQLRSGAADLHDGDASKDKVARMLVIDQQVTLEPGDFAPQPVASPLADTRDWPQGWADYRTIPLAGLIGEANRYAKSPIILDDPALASLAVTGRFRLVDTNGFVSQIAQLFSLKASRRQDGIHLSRK